MSLRCSFSCLTALTLQMLCVAHGTFGPRAEKEFAGPLPQEAHQHLNTSALNTLLAFEPYQDLARASTEPEAQQQRNVLFSPLGLASAVVLLSRVSRSESRSQAPELLGLAANSTERSVEDAVSSLTDLLHNLTLPEGRGGGGVRGAGSEAGAGTTAGDGDGGSDAGGRADAAEAGSQLKVWSGLHAGGKQSDYQSFLSEGWSGSNRTFDTLQKDLESSDELELNNYAYFKGSSFLSRVTGAEMMKTPPEAESLDQTLVCPLKPGDMSWLMCTCEHCCVSTLSLLSDLFPSTTDTNQGGFRLSGATRCHAVSS